MKNNIIILHNNQWTAEAIKINHGTDQQKFVMEQVQKGTIMPIEAKWVAEDVVDNIKHRNKDNVHATNDYENSASSCRPVSCIMAIIDSTDTKRDTILPQAYLDHHLI